MTEMLTKLRRIEQELAQEKGDLTLFGLFEREEGLRKWDVIVSAPWVDKDEVDALDWVAAKVQAGLSPKELISLSMVVPLKTTHPVVQKVLQILRRKHAESELGPFSAGDLDFVRGHVIAPPTNDAEASDSSLIAAASA